MSARTAKVKGTDQDAGCWIDGHWGQYGASRVLRIADDLLGTNFYAQACKEVAKESADLNCGHVWMNVACPAYRSYDPDECNCDPSYFRSTSELEGCEIVSEIADEAEAALNAATDGGWWEWHDGEFFLNWTPDLSSLTDDGDTFELSESKRLRLEIRPDEDYSINDYDSDGRIEWSSRTRDEGWSVRPDGMDGNARKIKSEQGADLWWQPYEGTKVTSDELFRIRELVEYGFKIVSLILEETCNHGDWHETNRATVGGCDSVDSDIVVDLWSEIEDEATS